MATPTIRKGMPAVELDKAEFTSRFRARFFDPRALQEEEVRNAARTLVEAVRQLRAGEFKPADRELRRPRPK